MIAGVLTALSLTRLQKCPPENKNRSNLSFQIPARSRCDALHLIVYDRSTYTADAALVGIRSVLTVAALR